MASASASADSTENTHCPINDLPELVLLHIFSYLNIDERSVLEETCKFWFHLLRTSTSLALNCVVQLHSQVEVENQPNRVRLGRVLTRWTRQATNQKKTPTQIDPRPYGYIQQYLKRFRHHVQLLYIDVEQQDATCRFVLCQLLNIFSAEECGDDGRQIRSFRLRFIGQNPLLMQSQPITQALRKFFHRDASKIRQQSLISCDLSGLKISLDDDTILLLAKNHPNLRRLNLQDQSLVCILTPFCILQLIDMLRELEDLSVDMISLCDEFFLMLVGTDEEVAAIPNSPLKHLGIRIRREEKFSDEIEAKLWRKLREKYPQLKMTLNFDITTPLHRIRVYMNSELQLPVKTLILNTPIPLVDEICLAANSFSETLENVFICTTGQWAVLTRTPAFNQAVLYLAMKCENLRRLYVDVALLVETIDEIFQLHPHLRENGASKLLLVDSPTHDIPPENMSELFG